MPRLDARLLLTCEHGGHRIPAEHRNRFAGAARVLASHRGWDPGALAIARECAAALDAPLLAATTTRLLVDLNRSPHNPAVFSEYTRKLPPEARARLLAEIHAPHWERVRNALRAHRGTTLHIAVHSFTPRWQGAVRRFDVGLLYDPRRTPERTFAGAWRTQLRKGAPGLRVRRNAPYRGAADGLTSALRREFPAGRYLGLELELNQSLLASGTKRRATLGVIIDSLRAALTEPG